MKKIIVYCLMAIISTLAVSVSAQAPFVEFTPVPQPMPTPYGIYTPQSSFAPQQRQKNYRIIGAYCYNEISRDINRVRIKINSTSNAWGGSSVYVRGVFSTVTNMWTNINVQARKLDPYMDGELADHFEYSAYILNVGTVFFNEY